MNLRPSSMLVRCALTLATLSLFACVLEPDDSSGSRPEYGDTEDHEQPLVDVTCFTEDPGCGCAPGSAPIDCTLTEVRGDLVLCEAGASYCVEGVWSECETVESWEMPRPKVISAPGACSPCNPDCFQTNDLPDQTDITTPPPGITSNNVQFVTGPPRGIRPIPNMTMMTGGVDTDMDGVPDSADACPAVVGMTRFFGCPTGVGTGGFFHVLPPGATAQDPLAFNVQLREADIYILVDRTGSMGGEIDNLRTGLATMMANIRTTIPDTWFGVGRFDDLPDDVYGTSSSNTNRMYYNLLDLNSSLSAAQTAVNTLATIPSGGDWPEANSQALYSMASGLGLNLFGTQYNNNRTGCPAGRWGYPCFRPNVIPIVILITDAESHNGPTGLNYRRRFTYSGVSYAAAMAAMNARNIRFIGVNSGNGVAGADLNSMAADTNSLDSNGVAFTQTIASDGSGLTNAMVTAVQNLANYSRMDVDVVVQNINILPGVPASALVQSITLDAPACAVRCTGAITNGCSQCLPGTNLPFRVTFRNNVIMPTAVDQVFNFDLIVRGNLGAIELQRVPVRIVVPANVATTTYMSGTFSRTFSASDTCEIPPTRPDWGLFGWEIATPGTSSVAFQIRTAETLAELNAMAPLTYTVPGTLDVPTPAQYIDLGDMIVAAGGRNFLPFLRVTAVLTPSADGLQPPTLTSMGLQYGCVDSE